MKDKVKNFFNKTKVFVKGHQIWSIVIVLMVVLLGYWMFKGSAKAETLYVTASAVRGSVVASVTGSGQVQALSQIDLKARATGTITSVRVVPGQQVHKGQTLFSLDARDAQKAVRDAETALETAQLDLDKFKQAPDSLDVRALQADIDMAQKSKTDADKSITSAYRALLNSSTVATPRGISSTETPPTITGTYQKDKEAMISIATYQTGAGVYFNITSDSAGVVNQTGQISTTVAQPIGDTGLYIKFNDISLNQPTWLVNLPNKSASTYAANLKAHQDALDAKTQILSNADLSIAQTQKKINDLYQPDVLDLRAKELVVQQRTDALGDAKANLSDYYVSAPFDGTISSVPAKEGDIASGTLATIITAKKVATISLNEVDIAKIKLGQKVTLTFDAIEGFTSTGEVAQIDTLGTVSQGVVNYGVQITFDTDSDKIKPGMSVSASIITDMKQDVLTVPASAVKTNANGSYVQQFAIPLPLTANAVQGSASVVAPEQIPVEIGLESDTAVEIISGIKEGDQVVTRTITPSATKATTTAPSLLGGATGRGGAGGGNFTRAAAGR